MTWSPSADGHEWARHARCWVHVSLAPRCMLTCRSLKSPISPKMRTSFWSSTNCRANAGFNQKFLEDLPSEVPQHQTAHTNHPGLGGYANTILAQKIRLLGSNRVHQSGRYHVLTTCSEYQLVNICSVASSRRRASCPCLLGGCGLGRHGYSNQRRVNQFSFLIVLGYLPGNAIVEQRRWLGKERAANNNARKQSAYDGDA